MSEEEKAALDELDRLISADKALVVAALGDAFAPLIRLTCEHVNRWKITRGENTDFDISDLAQLNGLLLDMVRTLERLAPGVDWGKEFQKWTK